MDESCDLRACFGIIFSRDGKEAIRGEEGW
jgi:hypothetical protein